MTTQIRNIGAMIAGLVAAGPVALTAGGSGDNAAVTGVIIDRATHGWPQSAVAVLPFLATLAEDETLAVTATLQHGSEADLSDAETLLTVATGAQATGDTGGSIEQNQVEVDLSLAAAKRYIRLNLTPDLSAADTDIAAIAAVLVLGGANRLPA